MDTLDCWRECLSVLEGEVTSHEFSTCILPLQAGMVGNALQLLAPNKYIKELVTKHHLSRMRELLSLRGIKEMELHVGSNGCTHTQNASQLGSSFVVKGNLHPLWPLDKSFTFDTFVRGASNEVAFAAATHAAEHVGGTSYNPLLLYGGSGLGKTHLMHAVGNAITESHPHLKVAYMYSQRFMEDIVRAIQESAMLTLSESYGQVDVLLMDDVQFLSSGEKVQEEFFHVFNKLLEQGGQIVLTCDRYPTEIERLEKRLMSRFVSGISTAVEPPDQETRTAILMKKAELEGMDLPSNVAYFIAKSIRSNVRELEGALRRVMVNASVAGKPVTVEQAQESLRDLIVIQDRQVSIDNIQKVVANYCKIRATDLLAKTRSRSIARPRQMAMSLARELTSHSLPEIGEAFGGRDHSTVIHACRKVEELRESDREVREDYNNLLRTLTT